MNSILTAFGFLLASSPNPAGQNAEPAAPDAPDADVHHCPVEADFADGGIAGGNNGGMAGNGWDGAGQGSATVFFHVEAATPDFTTGQRSALFTALQAWANVVEINFIEMPMPQFVADRNCHAIGRVPELLDLCRQCAGPGYVANNAKAAQREL